mmetsp:Transcript_118348/g.205570  ORF Transcript_118348/g.205570 Transcript_118348/m.205570 type:complete len:152 (+) Transcript_118348:87-542(+)
MSLLSLVTVMLTLAGQTAAYTDPKPFGMHANDEHLRESMRNMMAEDDEDATDTVSMFLRDDPKPGSPGFLEVDQKKVQKDVKLTSPELNMDEYMQESEDGLSAALGPRWNAKELEDDANQKTQALLNGIGGGKSMKALSGMMGAMMGGLRR